MPWTDIDPTGIPTVSSSIGYTDEEKDTLISQIKSQVNFSTLLANALELNSDAQHVVIDLVDRKVYASDAAALTATAKGVAGIKKFTLEPEAGQTGRSLTWEKASMDVGFNATLDTELQAAIAAVKPARSVQSMVSAVIAAANAVEVAPTGIVIDQATGQVVVLHAANLVGADLADDVAAGDRGAVIALSEPESGSETPLVFEGGATPA